MHAWRLCLTMLSATLDILFSNVPAYLVVSVSIYYSIDSAIDVINYRIGIYIEQKGEKYKKEINASDYYRK